MREASREHEECRLFRGGASRVSWRGRDHRHLPTDRLQRVTALQEFDEHPASRSGMEERDEMPVSTSARHAIDQFHARSGAFREGGDEVVYLITQVVHARSSDLEMAGERGVGPRRRQEFDATRTGADEDNLDSLAFDDLAAGRRRSDDRGPGAHGTVQRGDSDAYVIEKSLVHSVTYGVVG